MPALPVPKQSRRAGLADVALEGNPEFAKAMVNRLWALCFGRGLVHPVDHLDSVHPASHPALLEWLGRDFAASGYDIRRLLRECLLSHPYQLDAVGSSNGASPEAFAACRPRPLTAEALGRSVLIALGHRPDAEGRFTAVDEQPWLEELVRRYPDVFPETFNPSVREGLYFSNHERVDALLRMDAAPLVEALDKVESLENGISMAFRSVLGRGPDKDERAASLAFLQKRSHERLEAFKHLVWALLCSSEFRFNH